MSFCQNYCALLSSDFKFCDKYRYSIQQFYPWGYAISWQIEEVPIRWIGGCYELLEGGKMKLFDKGFLVITNQRVLFICKKRLLGIDYVVRYWINLENIMTVSGSKPWLSGPILTILDKHGQHHDFVGLDIHELIPVINKEMTIRKNKLQSQRRKERKVSCKR